MINFWPQIMVVLALSLGGCTTTTQHYPTPEYQEGTMFTYLIEGNTTPLKMEFQGLVNKSPRVYKFQSIASDDLTPPEAWYIRESDGARATSGQELRAWRTTSNYLPFLHLGVTAASADLKIQSETGIQIDARLTTTDNNERTIFQIESDTEKNIQARPAIYQILISLPNQIFPTKLVEMSAIYESGHLHETGEFNRTITLQSVTLPDQTTWTPRSTQR